MDRIRGDGVAGSHFAKRSTGGQLGHGLVQGRPRLGHNAPSHSLECAVEPLALEALFDLGLLDRGRLHGFALEIEGDQVPTDFARQLALDNGRRVQPEGLGFQRHEVGVVEGLEVIAPHGRAFAAASLALVQP